MQFDTFSASQILDVAINGLFLTGLAIAVNGTVEAIVRCWNDTVRQAHCDAVGAVHRELPTVPETVLPTADVVDSCCELPEVTQITCGIDPQPTACELPKSTQITCEIDPVPVAQTKKRGRPPGSGNKKAPISRKQAKPKTPRKKKVA